MKHSIRPAFAAGAALSLAMIGAISPVASGAASSGPITNVAGLAHFTNCGSDGKPKDKNLTIAFAQTDLNTPWRVAEQANFKLAAEKLCIPNFITNNANESVSTQLSNVSNLLARKPAVLILDPEATKPLTPAVDMAAKAHVPLIVVDRALSVKPGTGTYQLFIGADQFQEGYQSAKWLVTKLKRTQHTESPKGNIAIIEGGVGQDPAIERNAGVDAALKPYPGLKVVAVQSGNWTRDGGRAVMQAYIQRFPPGSLVGVFCASDEEMIGAQEALAAAHRTDIAGTFFTADGQLQGIQAVVNGTNVADTQNAPFYGLPSMQAAVAINQGTKFGGATLNLANETFTCETPTLCARAKSYAAQIQLQNSLF